MAILSDYTAAPYDVRMTQGDTFFEEFILEGAENEPIDILGYEFKSQLRRTADNGLVAEFDILTNPETSTVTRLLEPQITVELEGTYVHDFQWTDPQGRIRTLLAGLFEIEPEVTR
jgi:hypothetical protein